MQQATPSPSDERAMQALTALGSRGQVRPLDESTRTAKGTRSALGVEVGCDQGRKRLPSPDRSRKIKSFVRRRDV